MNVSLDGQAPFYYVPQIDTGSALTKKKKITQRPVPLGMFFPLPYLLQ